MFYEVTQSDIDALTQDGVVPLRGVFDKEWQDRIADAIEEDIRQPGPFFHGYESEGGSFHGNLRIWETHPTFRDVCLNS